MPLPSRTAYGMQAIHASAVAHQDSVRDYSGHVYANYQHRRSFVAAQHADIVVFQIDDAFLSLMRVSSGAPDIRLATQGAHVHKSHANDVYAIIAGLPVALANITHTSKRFARAHFRRVAGTCPDGRTLFAVVKFVPAVRSRTGADESWIKTAHFLNEQTLAELLSKRQLHPLDKQSQREYRRRRAAKAG